jgi:hypothetical protein
MSIDLVRSQHVRTDCSFRETRTGGTGGNGGVEYLVEAPSENPEGRGRIYVIGVFN